MVCLLFDKGFSIYFGRVILMELLAMVGLVVKGVTYSGYGLAGVYFVKTAIRYVQDYKESVANERG